MLQNYCHAVSIADTGLKKSEGAGDFFYRIAPHKRVMAAPLARLRVGKLFVALLPELEQQPLAGLGFVE